MRVEKHIAAGWAEQLRAECAEHAIAKFKGMRDCMLSGDSGLRNIWEEICAQVQGEESCDWDTYVELIEDFIQGKVEQLPRSAQLALWVLTDEGSDWLEDHFSDDDGDDDAPLDVESITQLVKGSVLSAAADYESPTLYRFLWDADDPQYDEEDEQDEEEEEEDEEDGEVVKASLRDTADPLSDCPPRVVVGVAASNAEQADVPNSYEARLARAKVRQAELSVPHLPVVSPLQFPGRFKLWQEHDLAKYRLDIYKNLSAADQQTAWEFIERNYLLKYPRLYRIEFEWGASGIWGIPFPGSVSLQGCYDPDDFKLPPDLSARLRAWHDNIDCNYDPSVKEDSFDWDASGREGLAVAKLIKAYIGPDVYLEYNSFRELKIVGDTVVELDVPDIANVLPLSEIVTTSMDSP